MNNNLLNLIHFLTLNLSELRDEQLESEDFDREGIKQIINNFPNPELINNDPKTAPSKRLKKLIPDYKKVMYGHYLAEAIGLQNIRNKCPRFNAWLNKLENIG